MNSLYKLFIVILLTELFVNIVISKSTKEIKSNFEDQENIETFEQFKIYFDKHYNSKDDENYARQNFEHSKKWIQENRNAFNFDIGITSLADEPITITDEMIKKLANNNKFNRKFHEQFSESNFNKIEQLPEYFDWREHIQMSPIISQGKCGSCWAFVAAVTMEANIAIHMNKTLVILSKQELIDCTVKVDKNNHKCNGGHAYQGWKYIEKFGIHQEIDYPLVNFLNNTEAYSCQNNIKGKIYHINKYHNLRYRASDHEIQNAIFKYGPIGVRVYAHINEFKFYRHGILKNISPNPLHHTHAFIVLGWGYDSIENIHYWIIRNSWGTHWGESGYGRIQKGINSLGINDYPSYIE